MSAPNVIVIGGNLTQDPRVIPTKNGGKFTAFGMAWNRGTDDSKKTVFIDCTAWHEVTQSIIQDRCQKGTAVTVEGEIDAYKATDGNYKYQVRVGKIHIHARGKGRPVEGPRGGEAVHVGGPQPAPVVFDQSDDSDLPF